MNLPNDSSDVIPWQGSLVLDAKSVGDHDEWHCIRRQSAKVGHCLPVLVSLFKGSVSTYGNWEPKVTTYLTLEIQTIAVYIHVRNPDKRCPLFRW